MPPRRDACGSFQVTRPPEAVAALQPSPFPGPSLQRRESRVQFNHKGNNGVVNPAHRPWIDAIDGVLGGVKDLQEIGHETSSESGLARAFKISHN